MNTARFTLPLGLCAVTLLGCATTPPPAAPTGLLSHCIEERPSEDVTSWTCGSLTAVETLVLSASSAEVEMAFDGFAANFGGKSVKRLDAAYSAGEARHAAMSLEGVDEKGAPQEAQMVAIAIGGGFRLVTCATKDVSTPCGPVMETLVLELPRNRRETVGSAGQRPTSGL